MARYFIRFVIIISLCVLQVSKTEARAESPAPPEYLIKAGFLYNFAKFVEWPSGAFEDNSAPLTICILGKDPFGTYLDSIQGKTSMGRKLEVNRIARIDEAEACSILFISESEEFRLAEILSKVGQRHILTVADIEGFAQRGGIISLFKRKDKIRFAINVDAAERAGLRISSKLLNLSVIIRERAGGG